MAAVGEHMAVRLRSNFTTVERLGARRGGVGLEALNCGGLRERYRCASTGFRLFTGAFRLGCGRLRARGGW